jgi:hypothetical protein
MLAGAQRLSNSIISQARQTAEQLIDAAQKDACALRRTPPRGATGSQAVHKGASGRRRAKSTDLWQFAESIDACSPSFVGGSCDGKVASRSIPCVPAEATTVPADRKVTARRADSPAAASATAVASGSSPLAAYHMRRMRNIMDARLLD